MTIQTIDPPDLSAHQSRNPKIPGLMEGVVVSTKAQKTAAVLVTKTFRHPKYKKTIKKTKKYQVHDPKEIATDGDRVLIAPGNRHFSKSKSHWLVRVLAPNTAYAPRHLDASPRQTTRSLHLDKKRGQIQLDRSMPAPQRAKDMTILQGWSINWRDHAGPTWGLRSAGGSSNAETTRPGEERFRASHDIRLQLFSAESELDAALFVGSFREDVALDNNRYVEIMWEFGCDPDKLWGLAHEFLLRAQRCLRGQPFEWDIGYKHTVDLGEAETLPKAPDLNDAVGFSAKVGTVEFNAQFDDRLTNVFAALIWPLELVDVTALRPAAVIEGSKPRRFSGASLTEIDALIRKALSYLAPEPLVFSEDAGLSP